MNIKKMIAASAAAMMAVSTFAATAASACDLTAAELLTKYGNMCSIEKKMAVQYGEYRYYAKEKTGEDIVWNDAAVLGQVTENGLLFDLLADGSARLTGLDTSAFAADTAAIEIPETVQGCPVKEIGYAAFQNAGETLTALREITVPDSVEIIAERAFSCCFGTNWSKLSDIKDVCRLNLPANVKVIGARAFLASAYALVSGQDEAVICLPETLEYISAQAFDDAIGSRQNGKIEVDMPDSLVFLSDDTFHSDRRWVGTPNISETRSVYSFAESLVSNLETVKSMFGQGFLNAESNIVSMKEILWTYLDENDLAADKRIQEITVGEDLLPSAVTALQIYTDMELMHTAGTYSAEQLMLSDVDGDGSVTMDDALALLSAYTNTLLKQ